jgi:hypothetical protein
LGALKEVDSAAEARMTTVVKAIAGLSILVAVLWTAIAAESTTNAVLATSEGGVVVNINDIPVDGASKINEVLPTGAMVVAGSDGKVLLRLADDLFIELQSSSELIIGETMEGGVLDPSGNPLPQIKLTLNNGSLVLLASEESLAKASVVIVTPRGTVAPVNAGQTLIVANNTDPATSDVTVIALTGEGVVTTTDGSTVPVGEGLAVVLSADNEVTTSTLADLPDSQTFENTVQLASASASNYETATAPSVSSLSVVDSTPAALATTTASASPTPRPPRPTPTPSPSPSPSPTPRPPRPTPTPSPSPSPSPSPTPTPRPPRPTPSPTQTPSDLP